MIDRPGNGRMLLGFGLLSLVMSTALFLFVHPATAEWRDAVHWIAGFFSGLSLPLLWRAWRVGRRHN